MSPSDGIYVVVCKNGFPHIKSVLSSNGEHLEAFAYASRASSRAFGCQLDSVEAPCGPHSTAFYRAAGEKEDK